MIMKMMDEATNRIKILHQQGLYNEVVKQWKCGKACFSEMKIISGNMIGVNYTFDEAPQLDALKKQFEKKWNFVVYYGIHFNTDYGECISLFYVSNFEDEWVDEINDLQNGHQIVCTINIDANKEEFGEVEFKMAQGGMILLN